MKDSFCNKQSIQQNTRHDNNYLPGFITPAARFAAMPGCFFAYRIENGYGLRYNEFDESEPEKKQPIIEKRKVDLFLWYMKMPQSDDDRLTAAFLQSSIVSVGVPLFVAKAVTGVIALTGMTPSQFLNSIRKKRNLS